MKVFRGSWKTTLSGIVSLVAATSAALALLLDDDPLTNPDWNVVIALALALISQISNGVGFLFTRDDDKSDEKVGAK